MHTFMNLFMYLGTCIGLQARGGDRPVGGTLQHLKSEGASTPPQRWITSTE